MSKDKEMNWNYIVGVYAFTLGCLSFSVDAIRSRPINRSYLFGCIMFDVGCAVFIADAHEINIVS